MRRHPVKVLIATFVILLGVVVPARAGNPNCNEVDGDYIVSFPFGKKVDDEIKSAPGRAISASFKYSSALNGFAATLTAEQVCAFKKRQGAKVEKDGEVQALGKPASGSTTSVDWYSWGLNRIDQKSLPLSTITVSNSGFNRYTTGTGVTAYIIDTGIYSGHSQFTTGTSLRVAKGGFTSIKDGRGTEDCNGHGTHVSGTVGGNTSGVANQVTLVPVRVLNCQGFGTWSGVAAGIDWVASNATGKSVANMSLGGGASDTVDTAVRNLIAKGVTVVVAAGNSNTDACLSSPARVTDAITVGASDSNDVKASYSNYGTCVDIYAPGTDIKSAWIGSTTASNTISGTSMATPHVTGIVARYLQTASATLPVDVAKAVLAAKNPLGTTGLFIACLTGSGECSTN